MRGSDAACTTLSFSLISSAMVAGPHAISAVSEASVSVHTAAPLSPIPLAASASNTAVGDALLLDPQWPGLLRQVGI